MITLTNRNTCRAAYIPDSYIEKIEEYVDKTQERDYPYSRVYIRNSDQEYYIDVVESRRKILELADEAQNKKSAGSGKSDEPKPVRRRRKPG